jgi:hypothetical protein
MKKKISVTLSPEILKQLEEDSKYNKSKLIDSLLSGARKTL